jgi:ATP-dependent RNA helicase SUPV3L1/SUV3
MNGKQDKLRISADHLAQLIKASPTGVIDRKYLHIRWRDVNEAVQKARRQEQIATINNLVYDPQRLTREEAIEIARQNGSTGLPDFARMVCQVLADSSQLALSSQDIEQQFDSYFDMELVSEDELAAMGVAYLELKLFQPYTDWYYLATNDYNVVYDYVLTEAEHRHERDWGEILEWAGDELREGAQEGDTNRTRALARLYSRSQMDSVLDISERVFRVATNRNLLPRKTCPDGGKRMRARDVHRLRDDSVLLQSLEDELEINIWQIRSLTELKISYLQTLFHNHKVRATSRSKGDDAYSRSWYRWGDVRKVLWPDFDHPTLRDMELLEEAEWTGRQGWWSERIVQIHEEIEEKKRQQRDAKDRRRREQREKREALRAQMIDNFPSWLREDDLEQIVYIHVGPTNSGKTHDALLELAAAGSGWYLAPLRLLAREMFERLNSMGVYCNLLTGEEQINVPGAQVTAATIEMFNADRSGNCVVIDEAHMVGDDQRGWAWTRALVNARAPQLRVITAPQGLNLLSKFYETIGVETQVLYHQRLAPLHVSETHWELDVLPPRTILIAFTRRDVLMLKQMLQHQGRTVSVVYGALPPEVRLKQAQRFERSESEICVATDAVGMGLNLPADNVVFSTLHKFDGMQLRSITTAELQQIAGRAGRYGLSDTGWVNGITPELLEIVRRKMEEPVPDVEVARLAPRTDELELLEGDLAQRLIVWQQLNAIPDSLRAIVTSTELTDRIELAQFLSYNDLMKLGIDRALTLVNAPVRKESQEYWLECATAILRDQPLPLPPPSPHSINEGWSLKQAETVIACMDIYLWLGYREPFRHLVDNPEPIIESRHLLTHEIDIALMRRFDVNLMRGARRRNAEFWYDDY